MSDKKIWRFTITMEAPTKRDAEAAYRALTRCWLGPGKITATGVYGARRYRRRKPA